MKKFAAILIMVLFTMVVTTNCKKGNTNTSLKPFIVVLGANPLNWGLGVEYIDPGAKAYSISLSHDTIDITDRLVVVPDVDVSKVGDYTVTYNATNEEGVSAMEQIREVHVVITK